MVERNNIQTLILILEEWVIEHGKDVARLTNPEERYSARDFMNASGMLFDLKGVKGETVTIRGKE